jgi:hypothetical protein
MWHSVLIMSVLVQGPNAGPEPRPGLTLVVLEKALRFSGWDGRGFTIAGGSYDAYITPWLPGLVFDVGSQFDAKGELTVRRITIHIRQKDETFEPLPGRLKK